MFKVEDSGFGHMQAMIEEFGLGTLELADEAAELAAQHIIDKASETVPLETGFLRDSAAIVYGGEPGLFSVEYDVEYATVQHETLHFNHLPGRRARWLALTIEEERVKVRELVRDHLGRFGFGTFRGILGTFGTGSRRRPEGYVSPFGI